MANKCALMYSVQAVEVKKRVEADTLAGANSLAIVRSIGKSVKKWNFIAFVSQINFNAGLSAYPLFDSLNAG